MESSTLYNLNIERAVLSAIVFSPEEFEILSSKLETQDFYLPFHQYVWRTMEELNREDKPIDEDFIKRNLEKKKEFDEVAMLNMLSANPIANPDAYIDELREMRKKRELEKLSLEVRREIQEGEKDSESLLLMIDKKKNEIDNLAFKTPKTKNSILEDIRKNIQEKPVSYFAKIGIFSLNSLIGGWKGKRLITIGARPSMGKTALLATLASDIIHNNINIRIDSLEMSSEEMMIRLLAIRTGDNLKDLQEHIIKNENIFYAELETLQKSDFTLEDESFINIQKLIAKAKKNYRQNPFKVWFIDHLRYIKLDGKDKSHIEIANITKELKSFAKEFEVDIVLLSQINREVNNRADKRPSMSDLRDSGGVEEDSDIVMLLHRNSYYLSKRNKEEEPLSVEAEIIIDKNRNGPTGVARCFFEKESARFTNYHTYTSADNKEITEYLG